MELSITHLYPESMNLYGDLGNVICLKKRAEWRGINVTIKNISEAESLASGETDLYFFGGGQDADQLKVFNDLVLNKKKQLINDLDNGVPMLAICGGYQLLGKYFLDSSGNSIEGIGFLPLETVAPSADMQQRAVGNLITKLTEKSPLLNHYSGLKTLVGFENHSGRTRFIKSNELLPLGIVVQGYGDNEDKISDGVIFKNVVGSYMHGSVLPKNPHLADYLLQKALEVKYKQPVDLKRLDDTEEIAAHQQILNRYKIKIN